MGLKTSLPGAETARKMGMVVSTFAVAMGIGFFMQQEDAEAGLTPVADASKAAVTTNSVLLGSAAEPSKIEAVAAADPTPTMIPEATDPMVVTEVAVEVTELSEPEFEQVMENSEEVLPVSTTADVAPSSEPGVALAETLDCEPTMSATVKDAALVELELIAACSMDAAFTIHHEGMMFTGQTDTLGQATLIVPALSEEAVFIAAFDDGFGALSQVPVPALTEYDRVVLQWRGFGGFEIHALEYGATYGETGHVWHQAPRTASIATSGEGGFMMSLGDARVESPLFAQVYTFPTGNPLRTGNVALSVEAEVTAANCDSEVQAQTLERSGSSALKIVDLTLAVPECETIGDFLVLKNLLADLTLAQG